MTKNTWTMRDVMRLGHVKNVDPNVGAFILRGEVTENAPATIKGFAALQGAGSAQEAIAILKENPSLPWEALPTELHKELSVWKTLFENGSIQGQALLRNVTRFARMGAFDNMKFAAQYAKALTDEKMMERTRLHPIQYLLAYKVHLEGQSGRYSWSMVKEWETSQIILDALQAGFVKAFKYVEPSGKSHLIALDVSGSMSSPVMGLENISCAEFGALIAMTVMRTEPASMVRGFTAPGRSSFYGGGKTELTDLGISKNDSLSTVMNKAQRANFGRTDCAQPILWATENKVEVETFVVITDNETYAGSVKPYQALKEYRRKTGIDARLVVVGLATNGFSIADPMDAGMIDLVGGDASLPRLISEFSAGRV